MADYIRPTPRNPILGLLADAMMGGLAYMEDPRRTQQMRGVGGLLSDTGIAQTVERLAYGEPLTKGKGFATRMKPETAAAAMTLAPEAVPIGRGAMAAVRATKGLPVGASIKPLNLSEGIFKPELTMKEMQLVKDIPTVQRVQRSIDLVGEKKFQEMVESQFKKYKPTDQDQEALLVESVTLDILGRANRQPELLQGLPGLKTPAPQEEALRVAQQRAALPVSEGGLGLPPNNTPMDRARAMGFETGWAHGSPRNDITELRSSRIGAQGPGAYATNYLPEASTYAQTGEGATIYPLMVRRSEALNTRFNNPYDELGVNADDALLSELFGKGKSAIVTTQEKTPDWLLRAGALDMPERQHFVSVRPENFRSRFAAFDPTRRNEPDLLAGALPFTALLDEETRARLEEQLGGLLGR
jgi:hypothetical protein